MSRDHGGENKANHRSQDEGSYDDAVLFVHEAAHALSFCEAHCSQASVLPNVFLYVLSCRDQKEEECKDQRNCSNHCYKDLEDTEDAVNSSDSGFHIKQKSGIILKETSNSVGNFISPLSGDPILKLHKKFILGYVISEVEVSNNLSVVGLSAAFVQAKIVIKQNVVLFGRDDQLREKLRRLISRKEMTRELRKKSSNFDTVRSVALPPWVKSVLETDTRTS